MSCASGTPALELPLATAPLPLGVHLVKDIEQLSVHARLFSSDAGWFRIVPVVEIVRVVVV